jgi:hypothetical protein
MSSQKKRPAEAGRIPPNVLQLARVGIMVGYVEL